MHVTAVEDLAALGMAKIAAAAMRNTMVEGKSEFVTTYEPCHDASWGEKRIRRWVEPVKRRQAMEDTFVTSE